MAVFQLGPILKARREELGLSQEDLADGICAVPTLSRIENGERMPTKNHFEMLMQRLGYSAMSIDFFSDKQTFRLHELKIKTRYAYMTEDYSLAKTRFDEFDGLLDNPTNIDKQFSILYKTLLNKEQYDSTSRLKQFEDALKLTCPKYDTGYIPHVLSYEEIILLNNIAVCNDAAGDRNRAIFILYTLKEYYEHHMISTDESLRTQPLILYNLSKYLGLSGRYNECIEICDLGIRIARTTRRCPYLARTLYNRGWALLRRKCIGDGELAEISLKQAYHFSAIMGKTQDSEFIRSIYQQSFAKDI